MKYFYKISFLLFLIFFVFTITVKADLKDSSNIFNEKDLVSLNSFIDDFKETTGYDVFIESIENIPEGQDINEIAKQNYLNIFPENNGFYYLISKNDGNLIIQYGQYDEIITKELVSVMLLSMNTDFENGKILEGFESSLSNGKTLIMENKKEIQERDEKHEVLETDNKNKFLDYRVFICIGCIIIFIINIIILLKDRKESKNLERDSYVDKNL